MTVGYECIDDLINEIIVELPGATNNNIKLVTGIALREFLVDSACWRMELRPFTVKANKEDYYLDPPFSNTRILYVHHASVKLGNSWVPMGNLNEGQYRNSVTNNIVSGRPQYFKGYADTPGKIAIHPKIAEDFEQGVIPTVSLMYREPWDGQIPVFITRYWREVLNAGILGKMMSQQDKPYSNPSMAKYHLRRFRSGIARAREMAKRQYTEADSDVKFPRFAQ